jgi:protein TonB
LALYGGLTALGLGLAASTPAMVAPRKTVAVSLEAFDAPAAPLPPPPAGPAAVAPVRSESPSVPTPTLTEALTPTMTLSAAASPANGGVAGGVPGGTPGGVLGGVVNGSPDGVAGGIPGGQGSAVQPPRFDAAYLQNPEPEYPALSQRLGEEGRVFLRVLVSPEGRADQVELKQSSGFSRLDAAAQAAVRRWRFQAARRGAEPVAAWVIVPITFHLDA